MAAPARTAIAMSSLSHRPGQTAGQNAGGSALYGSQVDRRVLPAPVDLEIEFVTIALVDSRQARALDRADMDEGIGLAVIANDEAESLHRIEELDRSGRLLSGQLALRGTAAIAPIAATAIVHGNDIADDLEILRRNLATAIDKVEFEFLTFGKTLQPGAFNGADMDEDIFTATVLLDEAEAFLRIEELDGSLAGADNLCGHAVESASTTRSAAAAAAESTTTISAAAESVTTSAESIAAAAAAESVIAATRIVAAAETVVSAPAEGIETFFAESVTLVPAAAPAPFVVTHKSVRTFVSPPSPNNRLRGRAASDKRKNELDQSPA